MSIITRDSAGHLDGASTLRNRLAELQDLQRRFPLVQLLALAVLFIVGSVSLSGFASKSTIDAVLVLASFLGIAAAGQTLVILIGGIDLSVPNIIAGANLVATDLGGFHWNFALTTIVIVVGAAAVGAINGFLTHRYRVPALIITLGSGSIVAGAVQAATQGSVYGSVPGWLGRFVSPTGTAGPIHVPPIAIFWLFFAIAIGVVLQFTAVGRRLYATGANEQAAELSLVKTERVWVGTFTASAVFSAITGIFLAAWSGTGDPTIGDQYLFLTIAAVIVGGTSLIGANGDYWRTVLGALILTVLTTILVGHSYSESAQEILLGVLILVVVATYGRDRPLRDRI